MRRRSEILIAIGIGIVALSVVGDQTTALISVSSTILVMTTIACWLQARRRLTTGEGGLGWTPAAFATCWLLLIVVSGHSVTARSQRIAIGVGPGGVAEFLYFCVAAAVAMFAVRAVVGDIKETGFPAPMFALPIFAWLTHMWSSRPIYTFGNGALLIATAVLGWGTIELAQRSPEFLESMIRKTFRGFIFLMAVLTVMGIAFGPLWAPVGGQNASRFTWIGGHPNMVGMVTCMAVIAIIGLPARVTGLTNPLIRVGALGLIGYAAYGAQSRTSLVAMLAGFVVLVLLTARRNAYARYLSLPYLTAGVIVTIVFFRDELIDYFYRNQSKDAVTGGNGRSELWGDAFGFLRTPFDWAFGLGYGQSDTIFLEGRPWATNAHSSVLGILVNLGLVGVALLAVWLLYMFLMMYRARLHDSAVGSVLVSLVAFMAVNAYATESVSKPGTGNALFMFVSAVAVAGARLRTRGVPSLFSPDIDDAARDDHDDGRPPTPTPTPSASVT